MKQRSFRLVLLVTFVFGGLCAATFAQDESITGAYGDLSVKSSEARVAAAIAIRQHAKREKVTLVRIVKAEQQVVAGMNYRICMSVRGSNGRIRRVTAVVWQPIRKRKRLTNWSNGGCKEI